MVDQLPDFFRTTHKLKTQQVVKSRGQHCGDIELAEYLANEAGPVALVLDLRITHDRIKYGNIVLTTTIGRRVRYHLYLLLLVRVTGYIANSLDFYSYRLIGKLTDFLQFQEFSQRNLPVEDSFTFDAWLSLLD
jgi:hypothetical protein